MTTEERLEWLENEAKRLQGEMKQSRKMSRWLGIILGVCVGAWLITGVLFPQGLVAQDVAKEIWANNFVVANENGQPITILGAFEFGPALYMYDHKGDIKASLAVLDEEPRLYLYDDEGNTRLGLAVFEDGQPGLTLFDETDTLRLALTELDTGPSLLFFDETGAVAWEAP